MIAPFAPSRVVAFARIPGTPVAQGRGRAVRAGARTRVIDPERSRSWKGVAGVYMLAARKDWRHAGQPLSVEIVATWPRPKSEPKRNPRTWRPSRPDIDNVAKAVLDAGNGVLWTDDAAVVQLLVSKRYGDEPGVSVTVTAIEEAR